MVNNYWAQFWFTIISINIIEHFFGLNCFVRTPATFSHSGGCLALDCQSDTQPHSLTTLHPTSPSYSSIPIPIPLPHPTRVCVCVLRPGLWCKRDLASIFFILRFDLIWRETCADRRSSCSWPPYVAHKWENPGRKRESGQKLSKRRIQCVKIQIS